MANWIRSPRIQKLGLALAGFTEYIHPHRVQILGGSEINYLQILKHAAKKAALDGLSGLGICCIVITRGLEPPEGLLKLSIPVLGTSFQSSVSIARITDYLEGRLAPRMTIHGVLLDVFGEHHMELRGLGIINIKELFGISATGRNKTLDFAVRLQRWEKDAEYDRLGLERSSIEFLGVSIPLIEMPVAPGRNVATLIEVAARIHLLSQQGHHPAKELLARLHPATGNN